jgi:hypothetical protein
LIASPIAIHTLIVLTKEQIKSKMMKRVIPLILIGGAAASRLGLSNVGVEETGDLIEFFPEEFPSREELLERARKLEEMPEQGPDLSLTQVSSCCFAAASECCRIRLTTFAACGVPFTVTARRRLTK